MLQTISLRDNMESLEMLLKKMWPHDLYFKKRDHRITVMIDDGLPHEILVINKVSLQYYSLTISEEVQDVLAQFTNMLITSNSPERIYNTVSTRLNSFLSDFQDFQSQVKSDARRISTFFESLDSFMDECPPKDTGEIFFSNLKESQQNSLSEYIDITLKQVGKLIQEVNNLKPVNQDAVVPKKLKFNLSVGEIALLFRLLLENKTIEAPIKEEMFRQISDSYESSRAESISINSLRKKFHEPDSNTLKDVDLLLINLRQVLKQIQQK